MAKCKFYLAPVPPEGHTAGNGILNSDIFSAEVSMNRSFLSIVLIFLFSLSVPAQTEPPHDAAWHFQEGMTAYQAKDYAGFLSHFREAYGLRPHTPTVIYNLACGYSLTGQADSALKYLGHLADLGMDMGADRDPDFDSLKNSPRYQEIMARFAVLKNPVNKSTVAFTVPEKDLIPEGIAYDPVKKIFYLGSIRKRKIITINMAGQVGQFKGPGEDSLTAVLGMKVDPLRRILWVVTAVLPEMEGYNSEMRPVTAVYKYDLEKGKLLGVYPSLGDNFPHQFNDLTVGPDGDCYITDTETGEIYRIDYESNKFEMVYPAGTFWGANGIDVSEDGRYLFVAAYSEGVYGIDLTSGETNFIPSPAGASLYGIDGLYYNRGNLLAVQNGLLPHRVIKFALDDSRRTAVKSEILEMNNPRFNEPTTGVIVGDMFYYIANSGLGNFTPEHQLLPPDSLSEVVIMKVGL